MTIPTTTQELRQFLDACANEYKPITYVDRAGRPHQVFLTKVDEVTVATKEGQDEPALALMMIETEKQDAGGDDLLLEYKSKLLLQDGGESMLEVGSGVRGQENFLLECVDATVPVAYEDRHNRKHRVFLTRMTLQTRVEKSKPDELQYALTMVDAWGGVWVYALPNIKVTVTATATLRTHTTDVIGSANPWGPNPPGSIGFAEIGGPIAPFSPTDIGGLKVWLKADAFVGLSDGDPVAAWADQSGHGNDLTQATAPKRPLYKVNILNSMPMVRFDGSDDFLQKAFTLGQPNHVFVVAIQRGVSQYSRLFDGAVAKNTVSQWNGSSPTTLYIEAASYQTTVWTWTTGAAHIVRARFNGANSGLALDGGSYDSKEIGSVASGGLTLCGDKDGAYVGRFDIGEVLVYDSILSTADEAKVLSYLNERWEVY